MKDTHQNGIRRLFARTCKPHSRLDLSTVTIKKLLKYSTNSCQSPLVSLQQHHPSNTAPQPTTTYLELGKRQPEEGA